VRGLLRGGSLKAAQLLVTTRRAEAAEALAARHGVRTTLDNVAAAREAHALLVCLKPQQLSAVLDRPEMREALRGKLVVSVAAGVRLEQLQRWLPESPLVRAMPNTPCLIGEGMTVIARGQLATEAHARTALRLFQAVGRCIELEDRHMDVVTSLNGSGPAFAYLILEALAEGGVMMGLRRDVAMEIAAQMLQGSARMVLQTGLHPAALKDQVTTPAGCTIAGLLTLEDGRIRSGRLAARATLSAGHPPEITQPSRTFFRRGRTHRFPGMLPGVRAADRIRPCASSTESGSHFSGGCVRPS
jgi:pyrroline-5-carboxylate reductase